MHNYEILGYIFGLYASCFCGACFAWYADHVAERRIALSPWLLGGIYALWRQLAPEFIAPNDGASAATITRVLILLGLSVVLLFLFYRPGPKTGVYVAVSWSAVFELSFFISYVSAFFSDIVYMRLEEESAHLVATDVGAYLNRLLTVSYAFETALSALLTAVCILSCRSIFMSFPKFKRDLTGAEFRLLILPALMGLLIGILLRLLMVTIADGVPMYLFDRQPVLKVVVPAIAAVALLSIVYAVRTLRDMDALEGERRGRIVAEEQLRGLREKVKETERVSGHVRRMRHDLRNTLTVIAGLSERIPEGAALSEYLSGLHEDMRTLEQRYDTGDPVADVLLAAKADELEKKVPDACFETDALLIPAVSDVAGYDLGVILGNALDNAIRAVSSQKCGKKRITLSSFAHGEFLVLTIRNTFDGNLGTLNGGKPVENAGQGLGIQNMKTIAERYDGMVDWKAEDGLFTLSIMLNLTGESKDDKTAG